MTVMPGYRTRAADGSRDEEPPPRRVRLPAGEAATFLIDLVVPVAGYYLLRAAGVGQVAALVLAVLPTTAFLVYQSIRRRKVDALGMFVLTLVVASVAVTFITGSPRFLLAKSGWFTGIIALGFFGTLLLARPLSFTLARALLGRMPLGRKLRTGEWDEFWARSPRFRRTWRVSTVLWGTGMLFDAVVRVVMAYTLPVDAVPALGAGLVAATFLGIQVAQHVYFTRVGLWRFLRADDDADDGAEPAPGPGWPAPSR